MQLDCGIRYARISAWLDDELGLVREDCQPEELPVSGAGGADWHWVFVSNGASCRVSAFPLESRVYGGIAIERTQLSAQGDQPAIDAFERLFTLRFISAGG